MRYITFIATSNLRKSCGRFALLGRVDGLVDRTGRLGGRANGKRQTIRRLLSLNWNASRVMVGLRK